MTYYRIQSADRDVELLLDPAAQTSEAWNGREDLTRTGVSVCESLEALAQYLVTDGSGIPYGAGEWVVVALEGTLSEDSPIDDGEILIHPTRIVAVESIDTRLLPLVDAAYDALYA